MSLHNRVILVTRPHTQAGELVRDIEGRGGTAVVVPMITIDPPPSWKECDEAIGRLADYDALLFTSVNAVESFFGRAILIGVPQERFSSLMTIAVGEKTAAAIALFGARVDGIPDHYSGAALITLLGGAYAGKRMLLPRGNIARADLADALQGTGAAVETVCVYVTGKPDGLAAESLARRVLAGEFDVITFASPSAAVNFASLFSAQDLARIPDCAKVAVIGPSSADAASALGLPADMVASESTARGLVRCIEEYYA